MFYKCFINLIKFQAYSVLIILIISSLIFFSGRINLKYEQKIMSLISYNYNVTTWINNNIQNDKTITSDFIRSHSLIKNKFISRKEIFFNRNRNINEYKKDLTKYNIDNVILLEPLTPELNQLLIECGKQNYVKKNFLHERRNLYNLFFKKSYKKFIIFENKCKN